MTATVLSPGFLTTVQDEGRTGFRKIGVSSGGALDVHASRVANLLVGNEPAAAGLEVTLGGLRLRFNDARVVAWCGGAFEVQVRDFALPAGRAAVVQAGEEIWLDRPQVGCRAWLAISGGAAVPEVLGSRSTDLRARCGGFEGRALRAGDVLSLGRVSGRSQAILDSLAEKRIASWSAPAEWGMPAVRHPRLRVVQGSEWSDFDGAARTAFLNAPFVMTPQADRMGVRLSGSMR
jgi:antagonist of KipI